MSKRVLRDLAADPEFNPSTNSGRGDWSLHDVTNGDVYADPHDGKPRCAEHGAMNSVQESGRVWRCLMCGRACYVEKHEHDWQWHCRDEWCTIVTCWTCGSEDRWA